MFVEVCVTFLLSSGIKRLNTSIEPNFHRTPVLDGRLQLFLYCQAKKIKLNVQLNLGSSVYLDSTEMVNELNKINLARNIYLV